MLLPGMKAPWLEPIISSNPGKLLNFDQQIKSKSKNQQFLTQTQPKLATLTDYSKPKALERRK
jgi:hypothetical protein